jgi:hypothetical protein
MYPSRIPIRPASVMRGGEMRSASGIAIIASLIATSSVTQAAPYDGVWSVLIVTERGSCDVYRWDVVLTGGRAQTTMAQTIGGVDGRGRVQVTFVRGSERLSATGRLSGYFGSGRWLSPSRDCGGRWHAERRG